MRLALIAAALIGATAAPALAQNRLCGDRAGIVQWLQAEHGEARQAFGLQRDGGVVEIFANPDRATWSILVTFPNGMTCLVAAGEAWDSTVAREAPGEPS